MRRLLLWSFVLAAAAVPRGPLSAQPAQEASRVLPPAFRAAAVTPSGPPVLAADRRLLIDPAGAARVVALDAPPVAVAVSPTAASVAAVAAGDDGLRVTVLDAAGTRRLDAALARVPDAPTPALGLHDDGTLVVGRVEDATLRWLRPGGASGQPVALFADAPYTLERNLLIAAVPGSDRTVVAVAERPAVPGGDGRVALDAYDGEGRRLWRRMLPVPDLRALAVAPDGRRVFVAGFDAYAPGGVVERTFVVDPDGALQATIDRGFERAAFDDGGFVLADARGAARYEDASAAPVQRYAPDADRLVFDVLTRADGTLAVLDGTASWTGDGFGYEDLRVRVLGAADAATPLGASRTAPRLSPAEAGRFGVVAGGRLTLLDW